MKWNWQQDLKKSKLKAYSLQHYCAAAYCAQPSVHCSTAASQVFYEDSWKHDKQVTLLPQRGWIKMRLIFREVIFLKASRQITHPSIPLIQILYFVLRNVINIVLQSVVDTSRLLNHFLFKYFFMLLIQSITIWQQHEKLYTERSEC